jgi:sensor histidine kinase YesM
MARFAWPSKVYWGGWLLGGFYNFVQFGIGPEWKKVLVFAYAHFLTWAVIGLAILPLIRTYPLGRHWLPWAVHLAAGFFFVQLDITIGHLIFSALTGVYAELGLLDLMRTAFQSCIHLGLLTYWGFVAIVQAHDMNLLARRRQARIAEQQTALVRAQLHSLKVQLQPHFLFNTMHSIASLMHYDVDTAERMLNRLSALLRRSLQDAGTPTVSLRDEIGFIEAYLDIERIRFEERLSVAWLVPAGLLDHAVPPFILQPLVENAIKYGIAPRAEGGAVTIRARLDDADLVLEVADDAPHMLAAAKGFGIGLRNTRARLDALYGDRVAFELVREDRLTVARIRMPAAAPLDARELRHA